MTAADDPVRGRRVTYIHHSAAAESSVDIEVGVRAAAEILGLDVEVLDPDFDQGRRRRCVEQVLDDPPDLVVAAVVAPRPLADLFDEVARRGIPWVEAGAQQEWAPGLTAQAVPDEAAMTGLLDEWLLAEMERRRGPDVDLPVAAWVAPALGPGLQARDRRRRSDFAVHGRVREVLTHEIVLTDLQRDIGDSTAAALAEHPDLAGLWQTCEPCVATQAEALDRAGRTGADRPVLAGIYSNAGTRRLVAEGRVDALVQVDTRVNGLAAVDLAVRHWRTGEPWTSGELALTPFAGTVARPWLITPSTVGADPDRLAVPGPDPVDVFARRWRTAPLT